VPPETIAYNPALHGHHGAVVRQFSFQPAHLYITSAPLILSAMARYRSMQ
jgi:hypothetical protein